jgi:hypothetical protein
MKVLPEKKDIAFMRRGLVTNFEFKCWIKGFYELSDDFTLDEKQKRIIKNHSDLAQRTEGRLDESILDFVKKIKDIDDSKTLMKELMDDLSKNKK